MNILLVEDNANDAAEIQEALTSLGLSLQLARVDTQLTFLNALREKSWDLIISTDHLGDLPGLAALDLARDSHPETPFVYIATDGGEEATHEAVQKGARDVVPKRQLSRLGPILQEALTQHQSPRREMREKKNPPALPSGGDGQFRSLVEGVADWLWVLDTHACFTYSNAHIKSLLGYEPEEILGKALFDLMPAEEAEKARDDFPSFNAPQPASWSSENIMLHKDGHLVSIETRGMSLPDQRGITAGYRGISRDITDRKLSEDRVTHLNQIYAMLSEINKAAVLTRDRMMLFREMCRIAVHHGKFSLAWIGMIDFHGVRMQPVAWYGQEDGYLTTLQISPAHSGTDGGLTGTAIRAGKGYVCNDIEQDDRMRPWRAEALKRGYRSAACFPLRSGELYTGTFQLYCAKPKFFDREVVRLLESMMLDVSFVLDRLESTTWREQAEQALRESEQKYRIVADNTYDWEFWLNNKGQFNYCSPSCRRISGLSARDFLADPNLLTSIIHPSERVLFQQHLKAEQAQSGGRLMFRIVRPDGSERWIEHHCQPIYDLEGDFIGTRGSNRDVTDRKQLEEQLRQAQKMEIIGHLSGGLAHDFGNILTVIQGHTGMLLTRADLTSDVQDAIKQVSLACKKAFEVTRHLLTFGRRQPMTREELDLNQAVQKMEPMVRRALAENIKLVFEYDPQLPHIHADACMLEQVLLNLTLNARDAMPKGGTLTIRTARKDLDESYVRRNPEGRAGSFACLSVTDTGCGIDPLAAHQIFEPFFTTKDPAKSSGLGLSTAYGVVKQHEGWIELQSQLGKGSCFRVFLPTSPRALSTPPTPTPKSSPEPTKELLLLVEDDDALRSMLRRMLERQGYQILEAASSNDALRVWDTNGDNVDLLITDIIMPDGVCGRELAERLRAKRQDLKVIYMSGYYLDAMGQKLPIGDGPRFLAKPFEPSELLSAVRTYLEKAAV